MWRRPICLVNARVVTPTGEASSIRFARRVLDLETAPRRGDLVIDAAGAFVLPGLINAHDHLELNHYGRIKERDRYADVAEWIDDMALRIRTDPVIRRNQGFPLGARLFAGAIKNLLAGVTTVAHHNPCYRELRWRRFPIRIVRRYGWAHSFLLQHRPVGARGELGGDLRDRYAATPKHLPFLVHVAEGVGAPAAGEFGRLESCRSVGPNTVMVHGVAIDETAWRRARAAGASLVWCPASNQFLFGRTAPVRTFLDAHPGAADHVALGSDSRLTGAGDLLDELRAAADTGQVGPRELLPMVTSSAARILRLADAGRLIPGARADMMVVSDRGPAAADALLASRRRDVEFVALGGRPLVGSHRFGAAFAAGVRRVRVDGEPRLMNGNLAAAIDACPIREPGMECLS